MAPAQGMTELWAKERCTEGQGCILLIKGSAELNALFRLLFYET